MSRISSKRRASSKKRRVYSKRRASSKKRRVSSKRRASSKKRRASTKMMYGGVRYQITNVQDFQEKIGRTKFQSIELITPQGKKLPLIYLNQYNDDPNIRKLVRDIVFEEDPTYYDYKVFIYE
jgi:hypothetical protein